MLYLRLILTFRQINISNRILPIPVNGFYFWLCIGFKSQAYIGISPILSNKRDLFLSSYLIGIISWQFSLPWILDIRLKFTVSLCIISFQIYVPFELLIKFSLLHSLNSDYSVCCCISCSSIGFSINFHWTYLRFGLILLKYRLSFHRTNHQFLDFNIY